MKIPELKKMMAFVTEVPGGLLIRSHARENAFGKMQFFFMLPLVLILAVLTLVSWDPTRAFIKVTTLACFGSFLVFTGIFAFRGKRFRLDLEGRRIKEGKTQYNLDDTRAVRLARSKRSWVLELEQHSGSSVQLIKNSDLVGLQAAAEQLCRTMKLPLIELVGERTTRIAPDKLDQPLVERLERTTRGALDAFPPGVSEDRANGRLVLKWRRVRLMQLGFLVLFIGAGIFFAVAGKTARIRIDGLLIGLAAVVFGQRALAGIRGYKLEVTRERILTRTRSIGEKTQSLSVSELRYVRVQSWGEPTVLLQGRASQLQVQVPKGAAEWIKLRIEDYLSTIANSSPEGSSHGKA